MRAEWEEEIRLMEAEGQVRGEWKYGKAKLSLSWDHLHPVAGS